MSDVKRDNRELAAARDATPIKSFTIWRHKKSGKKYRVYARMHLESNPDTVMIQYAVVDADIFDPTWTRPASEWLDKYEEIAE